MMLKRGIRSFRFGGCGVFAGFFSLPPPLPVPPPGAAAPSTPPVPGAAPLAPPPESSGPMGLLGGCG
ncbi:hypothetical protein Sipo8835_45915 [Streptomyces ipomoeae]|uniref:Uncharacterized protein n=1 Tax=Streptomyces ipomoeae TaxID=103232 RepID=A0AAE9AVS2_9ACTN|nr:hypothetical protein Sipo8835_45915 [Streptomyces ipomoeae]TQE23934.1 hypothetical protein Sipo7851_36765 [Streptomyces ipomoeae]